MAMGTVDRKVEFEVACTSFASASRSKRPRCQLPPQPRHFGEERIVERFSGPVPRVALITECPSSPWKRRRVGVCNTDAHISQPCQNERRSFAPVADLILNVDQSTALMHACKVEIDTGMLAEVQSCLASTLATCSANDCVGWISVANDIERRGAPFVAGSVMQWLLQHVYNRSLSHTADLIDAANSCYQNACPECGNVIVLSLCKSAPFSLFLEHMHKFEAPYFKTAPKAAGNLIGNGLSNVSLTQGIDRGCPARPYLLSAAIDWQYGLLDNAQTVLEAGLQLYRSDSRLWAALGLLKEQLEGADAAADMFSLGLLECPGSAKLKHLISRSSSRQFGCL